MQTVMTPRIVVVLLMMLWTLPWGPIAARSQDPSPPQTSATALSSMQIEGKLVKIEGRYYVIKDRKGKELYLLVSRDTELAAAFKPGDWVKVWASPVEYALAIRAEFQEKEPELEDGKVGELDPETIQAATRSFTGQLIRIDGKHYVLLDADGKESRILVNQDTELAGEFRIGDRLEVFTAPVEHAVAIKAAK